MALGMAFQLSDDIMDVTSTEEELRKLPGQDMREGVYTLPVLHSLAHSARKDDLARLLGHGAPDGERLDRALEIIRGDGSIDHARKPSRARSIARWASPSAFRRAPRSTPSSSSRASSRTAAAPG